MIPENGKYESITLIIKSRSDGETWFDIISDYISQDCQGTEEEDSCTCGIVSMGGINGTINQCWKYLGIDTSEEDLSGF